MTFAPEPEEPELQDRDILKSKKPNRKVLLFALLVLPCVLIPLLRLPMERITANGTFNLFGFFLIIMSNVAFWTLVVQVSRFVSQFLHGNVLASALRGLVVAAFVVSFVVAIIYILNSVERERRIRSQDLEDAQNPYIQTQKAIQGLQDDIEKQKKEE
jgi:uncharacterized membrane protein (DUF485 family)